MSIQGNYNHIHLVSPDPEAVAEWYIGHLDAEISGKGDMRGSFNVHLKLGDSNLYIRAPRPGEEFIDAYAHRPFGLNHISFTVEGIEGMLSALAGKGEKILEPVSTSPSGNKTALLEGPDGVLIELIEFHLG